MPSRQGISNRQSADDEARERTEHPPDTGRPQATDVAGRPDEDPREDHRDGQTSHKAGSRSVAQKMAGTSHSDHPAPSTSKVAGAFGREHGGTPRNPDGEGRE